MPPESHPSAQSPGEESEPTRPFPPCPNCGWHDVRIAHTRTALDLFLGLVAVRRFKCRSCGSYFRRWRRAD